MLMNSRTVTMARYLALAGISMMFLTPIYWMLTGSLQSATSLLSPDLIPDDLTAANYERLLGDTNFLTYLANSLLVVAGTTLLTVCLALLAGYALARLRVPARKLVARSILISYMFPAFALGIPLYMVFQSAGLVNTRIGLVLAHTSIALPFGIWLMWQFFQTVPRSFEESAFVMGAGRVRTFLEVAVPLVRPGLIAIGIFSFALSWEDFTLAFILTTQEETKTLPVGVMGMVAHDHIDWGLIQAAAMAVALPAILVVALFQKYLVRGLSSGGIKG